MTAPETITEVMFALCGARSFSGVTPETFPNQALQHNAYGCHGLCWRTLRASHRRG